MVAMLAEKETNVNNSISKDLNVMRQEEREKRIKLYGEVETQRQQITSVLIQELNRICSQDKVPRYIIAIAKILDNYQGNYELNDCCLNIVKYFFLFQMF